MRILSFVLYPLMFLVVLLVACDKNTSDTNPSTLPDDPMKWVCADSLEPVSQILIDELCLTADGGQPLPLNLQNPPPLSMLDDKNMFDFEMETFLRNRDYAEGGLDWLHDLNWRLTGPYVGPIGSGLNFGNPSGCEGLLLPGGDRLALRRTYRRCSGRRYGRQRDALH